MGRSHGSSFLAPLHRAGDKAPWLGFRGLLVRQRGVCSPVGFHTGFRGLVRGCTCSWLWPPFHGDTRGCGHAAVLSVAAGHSWCCRRAPPCIMHWESTSLSWGLRPPVDGGTVSTFPGASGSPAEAALGSVYPLAIWRHSCLLHPTEGWGTSGLWAPRGHS